MRTGLYQQQLQKAIQLQRLTASQMIQVKLLEMPLAQLEETVNAELDDNPALETLSDNEYAENNDNAENADALETYEQQTEREERADAIDAALDNIDSDDRLPNYEKEHITNYAADYEEMIYGDTVSFYDYLKEQMGETSLNEQEQDVLEYLIGSLDNDGLLRKDLATISDELAIYHNIYVDEKEIGRMLAVLQTFDPAGIGARTLQECLMIQIERKMRQLAAEKKKNSDAYAALTNLKSIIKRYFDLFKRKNWKLIQEKMHLNYDSLKAVQQEVRRLNPRPGAALGETIGRSLQQISPDFIVDTDDDGNISIYLNRGNLPHLTVSPSFYDMVGEYQKDRKTLTKGEREALKYARDKVERAQDFIDAVTMRRSNMLTTMKVIVEIQHKFFVSGDEADLKPMALKDVSERCGLDVSTISRVSNLKYVQTRWGIYPLRTFYSDTYTTEEGTELSIKQVRIALQDIVDNEDKKHPYGDEKLKELLEERGFPVARRTIAKYREKLGIPVARLRKEQ